MTENLNQTIRAPHPVPATLRQIAGWDLDNLQENFEIKASVPALQRGLVWSPQQVELLWDSILRGFPIGSFVVGDCVSRQERSGKAGVTHHLLDGQQRCNAITLGFHDPFEASSGEVRGNISQSILWLDIAPDGIDGAPSEYEASSRQIPPNSTREFLTRVTTKAHPWGYTPDDEAARLTAASCREVLKWVFSGASPRRPAPCELLPWRSNAPLPMAWLMEAARVTRSAEDFWAHIVRRIQFQDQLLATTTKHQWTKLALLQIDCPTSAEYLNRVYLAVRRALLTQVVVLVAPPDLLMQSRQEAAQGHAANISNIEHLFHRLNRQGKVLEGEELAYSLIKAYWPEVAEVVEEVQPRRVPASKMALHAVRVALTDVDSGKLARGIGIARLRAIANGRPGHDEEQRQKIQSFLSPEQDGCSRGRLASACHRVDDWLALSPSHPTGLPPVLVSSFARNSPDFYVLLLHLADRCQTSESGQSWKQWLPGIVTLLHWFTRSGEAAHVADALLKATATEPSVESLRRGLANISDRLILPQKPSELGKFIRERLPVDESLKDWRWWTSLIENEAEGRDKRESIWRPFLERTAWSREILIYAQRHFLAERFRDYDPSRRDLWSDHNRPWDFDHLHASAYFYNAKSGAYAEVCRQWGGCIGNLRAWPFEDNRSDSKETLLKKLEDHPQKIIWSIVETKDIDAFSQGDRTRTELLAASRLCEAIKKRYITIYEEWYRSTNIESLLDFSE